MRIARRDDWDVRLYAYLDTAMATRFEWGQFDCALFACDCVREMTGVDMAREFRETYASAKGAAKIMKTYGGTLMGLANAFAKRFELAQVSRSYAQRGDVVLVPSNTPLGEALGIMLDRVALSTGESGLETFAPTQIIHAWRI
jgi:hypothetical protein